MKKFSTLLLFMLIGYSTTYAQSIVFTNNDEVLEDATTVVFQAVEYEDWTGDMGVKAETNLKDEETLEPIGDQLYIKNQGDSDTKISVTVEKLNTAKLTWCGVDDQCTEMKNDILTKSTDLKANASTVVQLDAAFTYGESATYKTKITVKVGLEVVRTIFVNFLYNAAGISSTESNHSIKVANGEFIYSFDNNANYQLDIYNVTGLLVKSEILNQSGNVSLSNLSKGIYIYEVKENGKPIASHKCVVE